MTGEPVPGGLQPGDPFETVLLGCLVHDLLRFWRADGSAELVRIPHPVPMVCGLLARTFPEPGRYREVGLYEPHKKVLMLHGRLHAAANDTRMERGATVTAEPLKLDAEASVMNVRLCEEPAIDMALWVRAIRTYEHAIRLAIRRGEGVVVETGGWAAVRTPYVSTCAAKGPAGWVTHLEAEPAPNGKLWPEPHGNRTTFSVPFDEPTLGTESKLGLVGPLLGEAITQWARSPFDVVLTFVRAPDGAP